MRSRDDLRRQARTLFPGQRRRSRRASTKLLDGDGGEWRGCWLPKGCLRQTVRGPGPKETVCKLGLGRRSRVLECTSPNGCPDRESVPCKGGL